MGVPLIFILTSPFQCYLSPIQPKKQDNRKSNGGEGWMQEGRGDRTKFEKNGDRQYRGGLH